MHTRRIATALLAAMVLLVSTPVRANADASDDLSGSAFVDGNKAGYELEGVESLGQVVRGPGVPAWLRACTHTTWTLLEKEAYYASFLGGAPTEESILAEGGDPSETWRVVFCSPSADAIGVSPQILLTGVLATWAAINAPPPDLHRLAHRLRLCADRDPPADRRLLASRRR